MEQVKYVGVDTGVDVLIMSRKIKNIVKNTFIASFNFTFTVLTILLIVDNGNILTDGTTHKREKGLCQRQNAFTAR